MDIPPLQALLKKIRGQILALRCGLFGRQLSQEENEFDLLLNQLQLSLEELLRLPANMELYESHQLLPHASWRLFLDVLPTLALDPGKWMIERSQQLQLIRRDHKGKKPPTFGEIWKDPCILKWALSTESSLILIQGSFQSSDALDTIATDFIDYLKGEKQSVVWLLKTPTEPESILSLGLPMERTAIKLLAVQILQSRASGCSLKVFAEAFFNLQPEQPDAFAFTSLASILEEKVVTYIVVQLDKFPTTDKNYAKVETYLKVVLLSSIPCPPGYLGIPVVFVRPIIAARTGLRNSALHAGAGSSRLSAIKLNLGEVPKAVSEQPALIEDMCHPPLESGEIVKTDSLSPKWKRMKLSKDWFDELEEFEFCIDASRKEPDERHPRVKVAILDTGVDILHPDLAEEYKGGRIQYRDFIDNSMDAKDFDGHGTHCTYLFVKYAPNAQIYVGRVFRKSTAENSSPATLAKAIEHATKVWKVNIISLSLGFTDDDEDLRDQIRKACANNILLFAAAANNTTNEVIPIRFPARMKEVFCIFSSNSYGQPSKFNPPARYGRANFTFPGEQIRGAWPTSLPDKGTVPIDGAQYKEQDGISCATPIAAAVAAGILEFAWQERAHKIRRVKLLKDYSGMTDILSKRMVDHYKAEGNQYHYVKPWMLISTNLIKEEIPIHMSDILDNVDR